MKWIKIALKYCTLTLISSIEQKKAIFNVKYEIVLRTPYSKARCPPTTRAATKISKDLYVKILVIHYNLLSPSGDLGIGLV